MTPDYPVALLPFRSVTPENMHLIVGRFDGVNITVQLHIAPHTFIVDLVGQVFRNLNGVVCQLLGVVCKGSVAAGTIFFYRFPGIVNAAAKVTK